MRIHWQIYCLSHWYEEHSVLARLRKVVLDGKCHESNGHQTLVVLVKGKKSEKWRGKFTRLRRTRKDYEIVTRCDGVTTLDGIEEK